MDWPIGNFWKRLHRKRRKARRSATLPLHQPSGLSNSILLLTFCRKQLFAYLGSLNLFPGWDSWWSIYSKRMPHRNTSELSEIIWQDMLYALRAMRHSRSFAAAAVLTLALGIGGDTAMFTVIHSVLLKPLAYREPDRLVEVSGGATSIRFDEMKAAAKSYAGLGDYLMAGGVESITLSGNTEPEVLKSASVSANFLSILEVKPLVGRGFREEENTASGPRVAMVSSELWHRRFGGNPAILGKTATIKVLTILGGLYARAGRDSEAESTMARALSMAEATYGPEHPCVANVLEIYAVVLRQLNQKHEAKSMEKRAKLMEKNTGQRDYGRLTVNVMSPR